MNCLLCHKELKPTDDIAKLILTDKDGQGGTISKKQICFCANCFEKVTQEAEDYTDNDWVRWDRKC